ncbi:hypothetical protein [uncultured Draconibacterium sp.]|uniref:hypothetical protein n=1 Tax=uncultured Draconibacterium sp. TaxID=1573823 RepID=UPI002AA81FD2|nr:hypothetical protein [uncultured Draconibacterium sp.]
MKRIFLFVAFIAVVQLVSAQETEKSTSLKHFSGSVLVTNNGISIVPSFSLGEPAAVFDLSIGGDQFRFEPQFRFSMEGKPWAFIFWFRYKPVVNEKFSLQIGAHPAIMFHDATFDEDGFAEDGLEGRRFLAAEIAPVFQLTEHFSFEPYYLVGQGFDRGLENTHYLTMRGNISDLALSEKLLFSFAPEVYYLWMDSVDGFYCASSFTLEHREWPFKLGAMMNQKINTDIESDDFIWNISLTYSFGD